jgi:hypothetical protein
VASVESAFGACALNLLPRGWGTSLVLIVRADKSDSSGTLQASGILADLANFSRGDLPASPQQLVNFDERRLASALVHCSRPKG